MAFFTVPLLENLPFLLLEFFLGAVGAWLISRLGFRMGFVDMPTHRSSHCIPTPKGGGVGILLAFIAGCCFYHVSVYFFLSATIVSVMSLMGDRMNISPIVRLVIQFGAAFLLLLNPPHMTSSSLSLFRFDSAPFVFIVLYLWGASVFIVGTANFFNFMDGINGIAAITGIVGFGLLTCYGLTCHKAQGLAMICLGLALACAGFLPFNLPKARVFMGDVGSILLGFVFGAVVIVYSSNLTESFLLACFLFPFYADELITMAERIKDGQNLTAPHRRHLYQVLANEAGIAHWKISCAYGLLQLSLSLLFWKISSKGLGWLIVAVVVAFFLFLSVNNVVKARFLKSNNYARAAR